MLLLVGQEVMATSTYQKGDTLNVWAVSGLNMREGPGTDFHKIKKLEYGDRVVVIDNYLRSTPLSLTIVKKQGKSEFVVELQNFGYQLQMIIDKSLLRPLNMACATG